MSSPTSIQTISKWMLCSHHVEVGEAASNGPEDRPRLHRLYLRFVQESINQQHTHTHTRKSISAVSIKLSCSVHSPLLEDLLYCCLPSMRAWIIYHVSLFHVLHKPEHCVTHIFALPSIAHQGCCKGLNEANEVWLHKGTVSYWIVQTG